ncbi:MAG: type II toxin-antitoxin system RelE/ParE family toxin [Planctomycetaceae bacterium]|nr:type II toxin-antitoxin system RelE/ParE family toxin [Planctomycetaceae bacterium]
MEDSPITYTVLLTQDAMDDLEAIYDYIDVHDSPDKAEYVIGRIEETFGTLTLFPERGGYPPELLEVGIKEYRETFFKPYRIVYRIRDSKVYIMMIVDGRRNLQTLLLRRLLK